MNKYGGINDLPACNKRVYNLWFQMLRRCYDTTQHERARGQSYAGCEVCDRWKTLSCFAKDIQKLEGYDEWLTKTGYCLDKDTKVPGNKVYRKSACRFIPLSENIRDVSKRHPNITNNANEANKTKYVIEADGVTILFDSEKAACEFLGVRRCSVSSCYRRGTKCKGYTIARAKMDGGEAE
jgi:hypothetical protein